MNLLYVPHLKITQKSREIYVYIQIVAKEVYISALFSSYYTAYTENVNFWVVGTINYYNNFFSAFVCASWNEPLVQQYILLNVSCVGFVKF